MRRGGLLSKQVIYSVGVLKNIECEAVAWVTQQTATKENIKLIQSLYRGTIRNTSTLTNYNVSGVFSRAKDEHLKLRYEELVKKLNLRSKENERTFSDRIFHKKVKFYSGKRVMQSVWIGLQCIDFFIPNIRSLHISNPTMRGLAIEVDGDVHNYESKMRKDELKGNSLFMLGIGHTSVPNWEVSHPAVRAFLNSLNTLKGLDSRERRRLWRRIYLITLALHLPKAEFFSIFTKQMASDETTV